MTTFTTLGIAEPILRVLSAENYHTPTPIQAAAIPHVLAGRDVLGIAQTGTGKTAAFGLPLLQQLAAAPAPAKARAVRALILAPTRELAIQIYDSLRLYGRHLGLRTAVVVGGVSQFQQVNALARGTDVLIATPGRLLDLMNQKHVHLDAVTTLVIDEADRMFDMGFIRDVRRIVSCTPRKRQSLLFSATMPGEVAHLVSELLVNPTRVEIAPTKAATDRIEQRIHFVDTQSKRGLLLELLRDKTMTRTIVFTRTKHGANKMTQILEKAGHRVGSIHGNKSQNARQRALSDFRDGRSTVLIATDIAARGIDVDNISHVINLDIPDVAETYIHRIGRTARAGNSGIAISLCDPTERDSLRAIERLLKQSLPVANTPRFTSNEVAPIRNESVPQSLPVRRKRFNKPRRMRRAA